VIGLLDLICQGHLAVDSADGFGSGEPIPFLEASNLGFAISGDDNDGVDPFVYAGFEEEWDIIDDNGIGILACALFCQSGLFACDAGVNDSLKASQLGAISKDDCTQSPAIDRAIGVEDSLTECAHDLSPCRFVWFDDLSRKLVGVDDDSAALFEQLSDSAFAGSDAACEPDHNHGCRA